MRFMAMGATQCVFEKSEDADAEVRAENPVDQVLLLNGVIKVNGHHHQNVTLYYSKGLLVGVVAPVLEHNETFGDKHLVEKIGSVADTCSPGYAKAKQS